jgi:hypothetical protein
VAVQAFAMTEFQGDGQLGASGERYRALLAVSEAIISHRDLEALFQELAGRLNQLVSFDYIGVVLHEATTNTMRLHVAGTAEPVVTPVIALPLEDDPAGRGFQPQRESARQHRRIRPDGPSLGRCLTHTGRRPAWAY